MCLNQNKYKTCDIPIILKIYFNNCSTKDVLHRHHFFYFSDDVYMFVCIGFFQQFKYSPHILFLPPIYMLSSLMQICECLKKRKLKLIITIILLIQHVHTLLFLLKRTNSNSNLLQIILYKELLQNERKREEWRWNMRGERDLPRLKCERMTMKVTSNNKKSTIFELFSYGVNVMCAMLGKS